MTLHIQRRNIYLYKLQRKLWFFRKKLYQRFQKNGDPVPVFIIGSGRSGTDIAAYCLSRSWDVELINEDNPKAFDNWRLKDLNVVRDVVASSRARYVVLKPIVETLRAQSFLQEFESSRLIFVTRNPYDAINSQVRFFGDKQVKAVKNWVKTDFRKQPQTPAYLREFIASQCHEDLTKEDAAGLYWILYNDGYRFLHLQDEDRVLLVSYENLVQNPAKTTQEIATFLDLEWTRSMAEDVYSGSVGKNKKPDLSPSIDRECQKVWDFIKGSHDHIFLMNE